MADLRPVHNSIPLSCTLRVTLFAPQLPFQKGFPVYLHKWNLHRQRARSIADHGARVGDARSANTDAASTGSADAPACSCAASPVLRNRRRRRRPAPQSRKHTAAKSTAAPAKPAAVPSVGGAEPSLIGQFGTWGAYTATPNGKKVCFALAKPSSSKTNPPNRPRDAAYAFISSRPAEKVANEVSIMIGYQLKPGSEGTLEIGSARYAMYSQGDGLWIKNAAEEDRMVERAAQGRGCHR